MEKKALDLLLFALDHELTPAEQQRLDDALATSAELREEHEALLHLRSVLKDMRPEVERDGQFADRVMAEIQTAPKSNFWSDFVSLSPKVAAACILFVVGSLIGIYFWEGNLSSEAIIGVQNLTPEDAFTIQEEKRPPRESQPPAEPKPFFDHELKRK